MAEDFLHAPETEPYGGLIEGTLLVGTGKQSDIIRTWTARLDNSMRKKKLLHGCAGFVRNLNKLPGETTLIRIAFENKDMFGIFWFIAETEAPVGFVVVERRAK